MPADQKEHIIMSIAIYLLAAAIVLCGCFFVVARARSRG
jgi:hypothetical protein